jgi:glycosyltransferase involved in cell wall biosynthesis
VLRLALDATSLLGHRTGVGSVTAALVDRLADRDDVALSVFGVTWRGRDGLRAAVPPSVRVVGRPMAARPLRLAWRHADVPPVEWWTGAVDVVHGPNFVVPPARHAAEVVTVHDLTCVRFPEMCTRDTLEYPDLLARAARRGAWFHTVSATVGGEVRELLGVPADRVQVVPNGAPSPADGATAAARAAEGRRLAGAERYLLSLGTLEPRKDLVGLVAAFEELADDRPELVLVIAGPDGWGADAVHAAVDSSRHQGRIRRLGWVAQDQRDALLAGAAAFAYPSRYEGFGLPPLEAMAQRTPVVASRAGALPEVLGDAAAWAQVGDLASLAAALASVLDDEVLRDALVARGLERLDRYDWDATADGLVDLYRRAVNG